MARSLLKRFVRSVPQCVLAAAMAGTCLASTVTVDGTFLSFTSQMGTAWSSMVNGGLLTPNALLSTNPLRYLSNPLVGPLGARVDFTYGNDFTGGTPIPNAVQFTPAPAQNVAVGQRFQLGTFTFTNGQWWEEAYIPFRLSTSSSDPQLNGHMFFGTLQVRSVSAVPRFPTSIYALENARAEADYLFVQERTDLGSIRVYDLFRQPPGNPGNVGTFALDGVISSLTPVGFTALDDGGFTNPSVLPQLAPVIPEPRSYLLLLAGMLVLALRRGARPSIAR